jgi:microcystin-dependent protein
MAGLNEVASWSSEIYQIETTDPVVAGPPNAALKQGVTNIPHQQLAERTLYLKGRIENLQSVLDDVIDGAPGALNTLNELAAALGDNPNFATTVLNRVAGVEQLLNNLTNGAPRALNTLNELADALGDDPNFAATILNRVSAAAPAGAVVPFAMSNPPTGWLECNGAYLQRAAYSALFNAIGTRFGSGSTTFRLPDLRGQFLRGWDHGRGVDAGRALGSSQSDAIRNITGAVTFLGTSGSSSTMNTETTQGALDADAEVSAGATQLTPSTSSGWRQVLRLDASDQVPTAAENRPKNVALMFCIKY